MGLLQESWMFFAAAALPQIQRRRIAAQSGTAVSRTTSRLRKTSDHGDHMAALVVCSRAGTGLATLTLPPESLGQIYAGLLTKPYKIEQVQIL